MDSDLYEDKNHVTDQDTDQVKENILKVVMAIGTEKKLSAIQIMGKLKMKHNPTFRKNYLLPAIHGGYVEMTIPSKPHSKYQKYRLTKKGDRCSASQEELC